MTGAADRYLLASGVFAVAALAWASLPSDEPLFQLCVVLSLTFWVCAAAGRRSETDE